MQSLIRTALFAGAMLCGAAMSASALPMTPSAQPGAKPLVEKTHGFHRDCRRGHRNLRDGRTVGCEPRYYRDPSPGVTLYFGPSNRGWRDRDWRRDDRRRGDRRDGRRGRD